MCDFFGNMLSNVVTVETLSYISPQSYLSRVRVLLRHSVVVANPERIVINHTPLFTIRFGTSVPKSKSGSYISLFVLELSLPDWKEKPCWPKRIVNSHSPIFLLFDLELPRPNLKVEGKFHCSFSIGTSASKLKSGSCIQQFALELLFPYRKKKTDSPQFVLGQIGKQGTFRFGTKAEMEVTVWYETCSWSRKSQCHFSIFTFQAKSKTGMKFLVSRWKQHDIMIQRTCILRSFGS